MKTVKNLWLKMGVFASMGMANTALANDAEDVFESVIEKTTDVGDQVALWGSAVSILAIVCVGLLAMFGNFPKKWAVNVAVGSTVILLGSNIANFLMN